MHMLPPPVVCCVLWVMALIAPGLTHAQDRVVRSEIDGVELRLWVPANTPQLRGLIVNPADVNVGSGAWAETMRPLGFGHVGFLIKDIKRNNRPRINHAALEKALAEWAVSEKHPELTQVPLLFSGMSKGGGWSSDLAMRMPARTLAYANVCGWVTKYELAVNAKGVDVPGIFVIGGVPDGFKMLDAIPAQYDPARKADAPWTLAIQWGVAHDYANANTVVLPFLQSLVRSRLADDGSLRPVDLKAGWLGDRIQWETGIATIAPYAEYKQDKTAAVWLPDAYVAHAWRAFVAKDPTVKIIAEGLPDKGKRTMIVAAGTTIAFQTQIKDGSIATDIRICDGDRTVDATWVADAPGAHSIYAAFINAEGKSCVSNPVLIVVKQ